MPDLLDVDFCVALQMLHQSCTTPADCKYSWMQHRSTFHSNKHKTNNCAWQYSCLSIILVSKFTTVSYNIMISLCALMANGCQTQLPCHGSTVSIVALLPHLTIHPCGGRNQHCDAIPRNVILWGNGGAILPLTTSPAGIWESYRMFAFQFPVLMQLKFSYFPNLGEQALCRAPWTLAGPMVSDKIASIPCRGADFPISHSLKGAGNFYTNWRVAATQFKYHYSTT